MLVGRVAALPLDVRKAFDFPVGFVNKLRGSASVIHARHSLKGEIGLLGSRKG